MLLHQGLTDGSYGETATKVAKNSNEHVFVAPRKPINSTAHIVCLFRSTTKRRLLLFSKYRLGCGRRDEGVCDHSKKIQEQAKGFI